MIKYLSTLLGYILTLFILIFGLTFLRSNYLSANTSSPNSLLNVNETISEPYGMIKVQELESSGARQVQYFRIDDKEFIAIPQLAVNIKNVKNKDLYAGDRDHAGTQIYQKIDDTYVLIQTLNTKGSEYVKFYSHQKQSYLAVASVGQGIYPNMTNNTKSNVFIWDGDRFKLFQSFKLNASKGCDIKEIDNNLYLVFSTGAETNENGKSSTNNSGIYKLDKKSQRFVEIQEIPTYFGYHVQFLNINDITFLGLVDAEKNTSLYIWKNDKFIHYQDIDQQKNDREFAMFTIKNNIYLIITNLRNGVVLYKWKNNKFTQIQNLDNKIHGAHGVAIYQNEQGTWVLVSHYISGSRDESTIMNRSSIYKFKNGQLRFITYFPSSASTNIFVWNNKDNQSILGVANQSTQDYDFNLPSILYEAEFDKLEL